MSSSSPPCLITSRHATPRHATPRHAPWPCSQLGSLSPTQTHQEQSISLIGFPYPNQHQAIRQSSRAASSLQVLPSFSRPTGAFYRLNSPLQLASSSTDSAVHDTILKSSIMTVLTDYERQRLENIKKNQSLLSSLAIKSIGPAKNKPGKSSASASSTPSKKRSRPSTSESTVPIKRHATRASVRLSGIGLSEEAIQSRFEKQAEEAKEEKKRKDELKHSDRKLVVESWRAGQHEQDPTSFTNGIFKSISSSIVKTMKQEEINLDYSTGSDEDYDQLSLDLNKLELRSVNKVCPNRIYSMTFHPDPQKSLIFVGEKFGGVGIWDAFGNSTVKSEDVSDEDPKSASPTNTSEVDHSHKSSGSNRASPAKVQPADEQDTDAPDFLEGNSYFIQAHSRYSAVSSIQSHPTQPHLIYTSSYDATIRELNFETQQSIEIIDGDLLNPGEETLFSSFEFANQGREIWCSDNAGGLSHRDTRQPKSSSTRWTISKKKIGCLSLCPNSDDRLAATAGLNREMRLWDLRALSGLSCDSELSKVESTACLATYSHGLACSSAYFNHSGDKILSTSYDDLIRIWEFDRATRDSWISNHPSALDLKPSYQARHDNQTGRWVSVMKAKWCPNPLFPSHFTVGNMGHKLDVYNPKGELLAQLKHYALTTVPAVTAQHPTSSQVQITGAAAGGKVYLWT